MKRINVFFGPMYVARVEPFGTRNLLYVKMLLRAQKEVVPSEKHFLDSRSPLVLHAKHTR